MSGRTPSGRGPDERRAGTNETSGAGGGATGGTGAPASGDAHLGRDGRRLGNPANAQRQRPADADENSDMANGSGAD